MDEDGQTSGILMRMGKEDFCLKEKEIYTECGELGSGKIQSDYNFGNGLGGGPIHQDREDRKNISL